MGYGIMYNSVFIKSNEGITPVVLYGESNVYDVVTHGQRARRFRSWSCFQGLIGSSVDELMKTAAFLVEKNPCQEHWKANGKWVDDAGIVQWIQNGVKRAATLENILNHNGHPNVTCFVSCWDNGNYYRREMYIISTTEELDAWIHCAREVMQDAEQNRYSAQPVIEFLTENVKKPRAIRPDENKIVLIKKNGVYLSKINNDSLMWDRRIKNAMNFTQKQAMEIIAKYLQTGMAILVDAKNQRYPYDTIIAVRDTLGGISYVVAASVCAVKTSDSIENAKRYRDKTAAEEALKRVSYVLKHNKLTGEVQKI